MNARASVVPVRWSSFTRANGSIEIRHAGKIVAIVSKDHPDMVGNAVAIAAAPEMVAALYELEIAHAGRIQGNDPIYRQLQAAELQASQIASLHACIDLATELKARARNARRPPRRKP